MATITIPEEICVTVEDIEKAEQARINDESRSASCPIAQALRRQFGRRVRPSVTGATDIGITTDNRLVTFRIAPDAMDVARSIISIFDTDDNTDEIRSQEQLPEPSCLKIESADAVGYAEVPTRRQFSYGFSVPDVRPGKKVLI